MALTNRAFYPDLSSICGKLLGQVIGGKRNEGTISIYQKISLGRDLVSCAIFVVAFATLWQPHLLQIIMNAIMKNDKQTVWVNGLYLIGLAIVGIASRCQHDLSARVALGVATDLRADEYAKIQSLAYADVEKFSPSNLVVRMTNDINQVQQIIMDFSSSYTDSDSLYRCGYSAIVDFAAIVVGDCRDDGAVVWRQLLFI